MSWLSALLPLFLGGGAFAANKMGGNKGYKAQQFPTLSPEQQGFQNKILELLGGQLGEGQDFESFSAPYKRQFQEQTIPGLSERFAGLGGLSSSGFTQSLGQAGAGLNEQLASLFEGQKMKKFQSLLPFAFQQRFSTGIQPQGQNWLAELLGPILQGYGSGLGSNLGNIGFGG
jgi:hypothetical protein